MSDWQLFHTDCIPHMMEVMEPESVDMAVFSPPFPSLYAYSSHEADIGNTDSVGAEAKVHLGFFYKALARVLKPGRVAIVHVCQIPRMKRSGGVGLCDFRGINIRIGERAGLVYEYDIDLTGEQRKASQSLTGGLFVNNVGGIGSRGKLSQLAKGRLNGEDVATNKPEFIRQMVESWPDESTLIWCRYNDEQEAMERVFPNAGSIKGDTPLNDRLAWISWFKGEICTCERQRRSANTCKSIIAKTDTDGKNARQNSKLNTTSGVEQSMPHARAQAAKLGQKPGNGSKPSARRPLPCNGNCQGVAVRELQSRDWKVQRLNHATRISGSVPATMGNRKEGFSLVKLASWDLD